MADTTGFARSESPVLRAETFAPFAGRQYADPMTVDGAVARTGLLLAITIAAGAGSWLLMPHAAGLSRLVGWLLLAGLASLGAFTVGLITVLRKRAAPFTAPLYALLEGAALGGALAILEATYPGVAVQATVLTFAATFSLLVLYAAGGISLSGASRRAVVLATLAIALAYGMNVGLRLLGVASLPFLHDSSVVAVALSLLVVFVAALNLVLDFDLIATGARQGAPKYMEWYAAYGLMVTGIWLYFELVKLLIQVSASSDR